MESPLADLGVTVFVPLFNEDAVLEANTCRVQQALLELHSPHEIILGSNGSTDRTPGIGRELAAAAPETVVFFHVNQRGPGRAFAEAVRRARYPYLVTLDADLSFDLRFVSDAVRELACHDAVVGSKVMGTQRRPFVRVAASESFIFLSRLLLRLPYRDYSIGAKAYRTSWLRRFLSRVDAHTFYTQEMLYQIHHHGGRIVEIPVSCEDYRASRFNLLHEGLYRYGRLFQRWARSLVE